MRDAARVDHGRSDVVDQLFFDQRLAVPDAVENLAHSNGRGGVVAYPLEGFLVFSGRWVFHPEQAHGLQRFAQLARLNGR